MGYQLYQVDFVRLIAYPKISVNEIVAFIDVKSLSSDNRLYHIFLRNFDNQYIKINIHIMVLVYMWYSNKPKLLVSAGHLYELQGLFSEIDNLCRVNRIELQLLWRCDVFPEDGCLQTPIIFD